MVNNKVKFAIVGCGRISYRHIEAITANQGAELVALCDLNLERARERGMDLNVKLYRDYNQMLKEQEIDVVGIMTPSGMHAEHAMDIIDRYRKHVIIEKPVCLKISDGMELIECARKNKVKLFAVHQNRFNKPVRKIRDGIENNSIGKLVLGTVRLRWSRGQAYYDRDPWRGTWALDGGVLTNQAIHHIDLLRWLAGEVESVSAIAATRLVRVEVEDTACIWLKFTSGALGMIEATTAVRPLNNDLEASISLLGENGVAIVEGASVNKLVTWTFGDINLAEFSENPPNVYGFGHDQIINNVVDTIAGKSEPAVNIEDAFKTVVLLSAIYRSIELGGKEVYLKDNPVSEKLGVIDKEHQKIADLYRTDVVLKREKKCAHI